MNDVTLSILDSIPESDIFPLIQQISPALSFEEFQGYLREMKTQGYFMIAAHQDEEIVGLSGVWIATKFYCGKYLELDNFVIDASHRGKGIGSMLINYAVALAQEKGCKSLVLNATVENVEAHKLYDRYGFIRFGHHRLLWL